MDPLTTHSVEPHAAYAALLLDTYLFPVALKRPLEKLAKMTGDDPAQYAFATKLVDEADSYVIYAFRTDGWLDDAEPTDLDAPPTFDTEVL